MRLAKPVIAAIRHHLTGTAGGLSFCNSDVPGLLGASFTAVRWPKNNTAAACATPGCEQVLPEVQEILDALAPMPASVVKERFDLLAWNAPYEELWPGVTGAAPGERNILWQCFTYPDCCHPHVNRHAQLAMLVAQLRSAYGRHLGEPAWTGFVRRLSRSAPRSPGCETSTTWPARRPT
jgi:hypothetical protein